MIWKTRLQRILDRWEPEEEDVVQQLHELGDVVVAKPGEARALCKALSRESMQTPPADGFRSRSVHALVALCQSVDGKEAADLIRVEGLPQLRRLLDEGVAQPANRASDVLFIAKVLALYREQDDAERVGRLARSGFAPDEYLWSVVLSVFRPEHEHARIVVDALRDPLPERFLGIAYLDQVNQLAIAGKLPTHPFDTPSGCGRLRHWLTDTDLSYASYARSATTALPFLRSRERDDLFELAADHADLSVRMEAAWAAARSGDESGIAWLVDWAKDPIHSDAAVRLLEELGRADVVPAEAKQPTFKAIAEMAGWLAHPQEFGRPPDAIELFDTRRLHWPPTDDERTLSLVRYTYNPTGDETEPDIGVGMVGSVTFALFGENSADLTPAQLYGLHCAWELEGNGDSRAPDERTPTAGLAILRRSNPDL